MARKTQINSRFDTSTTEKIEEFARRYSLQRASACEILVRQGLVAIEQLDQENELKTLLKQVYQSLAKSASYLCTLQPVDQVKAAAATEQANNAAEKIFGVSKE